MLSFALHTAITHFPSHSAINSLLLNLQRSLLHDAPSLACFSSSVLLWPGYAYIQPASADIWTVSLLTQFHFLSSVCTGFCLHFLLPYLTLPYLCCASILPLSRSIPTALHSFCACLPTQSLIRFLSPLNQFPISTFAILLSTLRLIVYTHIHTYSTLPNLHSLNTRYNCNWTFCLLSLVNAL